MSMLDRAEAIASAAHQGRTDKRGSPFVAHVRRVADGVEGEDAKTAAMLHDVVEKGPGWTLQRLTDEGFPGAIVAAVDALTRREGEADRDFVHRAASLPLARVVKLADLRDNLESARRFMSGPDAEARIRRYEEDLRALGETTRR